MIRHLLLALMLAAPVLAVAAPEPENPDRRTFWGLYLTSAEAAAMKAEAGDAVLFIDVRDPIEIMFTGWAEPVDVNVPLLLSNPRGWMESRGHFAMERNPRFAEDVLAALAARGLGPDTPVILMCRSGGERGAPSARALEHTGLEEVHVVVDGFEGSTADDPINPARTVSGWKNSGLPWTWRLDPAKMYKRP